MNKLKLNLKRFHKSSIALIMFWFLMVAMYVIGFIFLSFSSTAQNFDNYKKIRVLKKISYNFKKGMIYSLMGPSGSGKSTLLNLISFPSKPFIR